MIGFGLAVRIGILRDRNVSKDGWEKCLEDRIGKSQVVVCVDLREWATSGLRRDLDLVLGLQWYR